MPTTSYPSDFNSAAVTEESTPPDMATTTRVSCGRPSRSRLLRIPAAASAALLHFQGYRRQALTIGTDCGQAMRARKRGPPRQFLPLWRKPCRCPGRLLFHKILELLEN